MDIQNSLGRFIERQGSSFMHGAASQLLELLEADEVEPIGAPGDPITAEEVAERLESRLVRLRKKADLEPAGVSMIEDAVAHLRANDEVTLEPWTFEDGEGIRWFVLADEDEDVIACYTSAPFVEADI